MKEFEELKPLEKSPTIKHIMYPIYEFFRGKMSEEEKKKTDLNDKKVAWMLAVSQKKRSEMTDQEIYFYDKYKSEHLDFSQFWFYNSEITLFLEEQITKVQNEIKHQRG